MGESGVSLSKVVQQLAGHLRPLSSSISPAFARKILFLHCNLSLALHQPEQALHTRGEAGGDVGGVAGGPGRQPQLGAGEGLGVESRV